MVQQYRAMVLMPGQSGAFIKPGMGKELWDKSPVYKVALTEAIGPDSAVQQYANTVGDDVDFLQLCLDGDVNEARKANRAPVLLCGTSTSLARHLEANEGIVLGDDVLLMGHSAGQYPASTVGGVFTFAQAPLVLLLRGNAQLRAYPMDPNVDGAPMLVVIGRTRGPTKLTVEKLEAACDAAEAEFGGHVSVACDNYPGQIVVSGTPTTLAKMDATFLKRHKIRGSVALLSVGGPYHETDLFADAPRFFLESIAAAQIEVNKSTRPLMDPSQVQLLGTNDNHLRSLANQIPGRVNFRLSIEDALGRGIREFAFMHVRGAHAMREFVVKIAQHAGVEVNFHDLMKPDEVAAFRAVLEG